MHHVCRLAVATNAAYPQLHPDDLALAACLEALRMQVVPCDWRDPAVDWASFDAVLVRTIWDYYEHYTEFLGWLDRLDRAGVPTVNDSRMLRWNSDKRYLVALGERGVPVIPSRVLAGEQLGEVLQGVQDTEWVIKPTTSAGAWHTVRGRSGDEAFAQAVAQLPRRLDYLLQPFVPEVLSEGEWSLLYFGGEFSHALIKRPAAGDYRVQEEFGGRVSAATPDPLTLATAERTLAVAAELGYGEPAYARIDGVISAGRFLIMELELIEPSLYLATSAGADARFAEVLTKRLARQPSGA